MGVGVGAIISQPILNHESKSYALGGHITNHILRSHYDPYITVTLWSILRPVYYVHITINIIVTILVGGAGRGIIS